MAFFFTPPPAVVPKPEGSVIISANIDVAVKKLAKSNRLALLNYSDVTPLPM